MDRRTFLAGLTGGTMGLVLSRWDAEAETLLKAGRITAMPDWDKALRRDLLEQSMKG